MSTFKDTSNWQQKSKTVLSYPIETKGKRSEGSSEMKPQTLGLLLDRLSVHRDTSWTLGDDQNPDGKPGYMVRDYISAFGVLDGSVLHAITLDSTENDRDDRVFVNIFPIDGKRLTETSVTDARNYFRSDDKPEDGWLKDEIGVIRYYGSSEYNHYPQFSATLYLPNDRFNDVAEAIRSNSIRAANLDILADVFYFPHEGSFGLREQYNYAILCTDGGPRKGVTGSTKARLEQVRLEWSPKIVNRMAHQRDERTAYESGKSGDTPPSPNQSVDKTVLQLSRDLSAIKGRIDTAYSVAVAVMALVVLREVYFFFAG